MTKLSLLLKVLEGETDETLTAAQKAVDAAQAAQEETADDDDVQSPGDHLQPGHLGHETDGGLEDGGQRAAGLEIPHPAADKRRASR